MHSLRIPLLAACLAVADAETHFRKAGSPASLKGILVGSRVVIHAYQNGDKFHAPEVKIATSTSTQHP